MKIQWERWDWYWTKTIPALYFTSSLRQKLHAQPQQSRRQDSLSCQLQARGFHSQNELCTTAFLLLPPAACCKSLVTTVDSSLLPLSSQGTEHAKHTVAPKALLLDRGTGFQAMRGKLGRPQAAAFLPIPTKYSVPRGSVAQKASCHCSHLQLQSSDSEIFVWEEKQALNSS